jgi:hypothetical protein
MIDLSIVALPMREMPGTPCGALHSEWLRGSLADQLLSTDTGRADGTHPLPAQ